MIPMDPFPGHAGPGVFRSEFSNSRHTINLISYIEGFQYDDFVYDILQISQHKELRYSN